MKPIEWRRTRLGNYLRHLPRLKHLKGGWLHRRLGDSLFAPELWHPERHTVAAGFAVGVFFAMMPMPFQTLPAVLLAYMTRVNLPATLIAIWVSNPLTTPVFLYLQYHIGRFVMGQNPTHAAEAAGNVIEFLKAAPVPILTGAMIMGLISVLIAYPLAGMGWTWIIRIVARSRARRSARFAGKNGSRKSPVPAVPHPPRE